MTVLSEIGRTLGGIADNSGNQWEAMTEQQLTAMMQGLGIAATQCSAFLTSRLGNDIDRAELEIGRAMDLPPKVLRRRAKEAENIINADGLPDIPQHAAWVAILLAEIQAIGARIERKQAGGALN